MKIGSDGVIDLEGETFEEMYEKAKPLMRKDLPGYRGHADELQHDLTMGVFERVNILTFDTISIETSSEVYTVQILSKEKKR